MTGSDEKEGAFLPVRMLNEYVYCPRLFYLEWVENEFKDSKDTIEGKIVHRNVDAEAGSLPYNAQKSESLSPAPTKATSVYMSSITYGITSIMDLVEVRDGEFSPIEYKKSKSPDNDGRVWPSDAVQICAQAMILKDNGFPVDRGFIYYAGSKERISVEISDQLVKWTSEVIEIAKKTSASGRIPEPLRHSQKCEKCSMASLCLPDETLLLKDGGNDMADEEVRRLYPARHDSLPLYVQHQGAYISKKNEELEIRGDGKTLSTVRMMDISSLSVFGNVQITTQSINELCRRNIGITYFTAGGWFNGITTGLSHKNVQLRIMQYAAAQDKDKALSISRAIVEGKIRNSRTMLRRNSQTKSESALSQLQIMYRNASKAEGFQELLGIEGNAAKIYFSHFVDMIKEVNLTQGYNFENRNRRPPKDPVNAVLSLLYALLTKDLVITLLSVGFDPYMGFYHQPKYGKPALALDLMEEFRPLIADSTAITLFNGKEIRGSDFIRKGIGTALTDDGRKKVIRGYEKRMDSLVTHPLFGYTISYRRTLEVQCRLVARWLAGEIKDYKMFCTR